MAYSYYHNPTIPRNKEYLIFQPTYDQELSNTYDYVQNYESKETKQIYKTEHVLDNGYKSYDDSILESEVYKDNQKFKDIVPPMKDGVTETYKEETLLISPYMDWNHYHRLDTIHNFMDDLEYDFPAICTTGVIGQSLEGRDLKILRISNSNASNASVWLDAGIHAREWIAPATATFIADYFARNFETLPEYITNKDWYFLPVMNPDGYEYSHLDNRMWRKNRRWLGNQCVGVDLNRNFSIGWGGKGSSDNPTNPFYRGPGPFSEPESTAVRDMIAHSGISFSVYITLHSYGQLIMFPFAYRDELCPDYVRLLQGATVMSKAIFENNGNTYKVGISRDVMYGASGTSNDWCYGEAGIPYCYLIELRSKEHKFKLPSEEIKETGNEILDSVQALMEFVDNYKEPEIKFVNTKYNRLVVPKITGNFVLCGDVVLHGALKAGLNARRRSKLFKVASLRQPTQVWQIKFSVEGQRCFVKSLDTVGAINIWKEEPSTMEIMVEGLKSGQVAGMLYERGIPYSVAVGDVGLLLEMEQSQLSSSNSCKRKPRKMDWNGYHRLDVINAFLEELAADYPYLCSVTVIGKSVEGRDLKMLKVSNGRSDNPGVWLDGSIHPREWISTAVVTYIADQLVKTFHKQPVSVTGKDWYILPVLNPDGYEYTHTYDRMWRKNRARYGECVGVDLNRNFGYGWGEHGEEGSSEDPGNIFFRGPKPFSEPETSAVRRTITESGTEFKVFLSFHSYGEVIIFPWGYTGDPCPDYVELLRGGTAMAKAIHEVSGHTYKVGSTKDLMYYAAGTSTDWAYAVANIPYAYMVELRSKKHRFILPKEDIVPTAIEVLSGVLKLMDFVDGKCSSTHSSNFS